MPCLAFPKVCQMACQRCKTSYLSFSVCCALPTLGYLSPGVSYQLSVWFKSTVSVQVGSAICYRANIALLILGECRSLACDVVSTTCDTQPSISSIHARPSACTLTRYTCALLVHAAARLRVHGMSREGAQASISTIVLLELKAGLELSALIKWLSIEEF